MPNGKILISRVLSAVALALAAALPGCGSGVGPLDALSSDLPRPTDYPIHGIDVSKFQGDIDWNAVANSGVKFAWIKATEGRRSRRRALPGQLDRRESGRSAARRLSFRLLVPAAAGGDGVFRAERPGRGRCAAAGARRRGDADVEDLPSPSHPGRRHRRHEGDAGGNGAPLRQAADHLHDGRLLPGDPVRTAPSWTIRSGFDRRSITPPSNTGRGPGISGNTNPTARSPASRLMSIATPFLARRSSGKPFSASEESVVRTGDASRPERAATRRAAQRPTRASCRRAARRSAIRAAAAGRATGRRAAAGRPAAIGRRARHGTSTRTPLS